MDQSRFDALSRTLCAPGSRRRAFGILLAGALGLLRTRGEETAAKKKKSCPPCKKRKKGKCKKVPNGTACRNGTCQSGSCVATVVPAPPATCPGLVGAEVCADQPDACCAPRRCLVDITNPEVCCSLLGEECGFGSTGRTPPPRVTCCFDPADPDGIICGATADPDVRVCCRTSGIGQCTPATAGQCCTRFCGVSGLAAGRCCVPAGQDPFLTSGDFCSGADNELNPACCSGRCGRSGSNYPATVCGEDDTCGTANACTGDTTTCGQDGTCFQPLGGGPTRCGASAGPATCGCTSDAQCINNHGAGAFCVTFPAGGPCGCPGTSTTFCAVPR